MVCSSHEIYTNSVFDVFTFTTNLKKAWVAKNLLLLVTHWTLVAKICNKLFAVVSAFRAI